MAKNFGESITIDEDTASSSEGEEYAPAKLYPVRTSKLCMNVCIIEIHHIIKLFKLINTS